MIISDVAINIVIMNNIIVKRIKMDNIIIHCSVIKYSNLIIDTIIIVHVITDTTSINSSTIIRQDI